MTKIEAFAILGIDDKRDAKSAMRKLVQIHHPDKGGTTARYIEIMDAYRLVTNNTYRMNVERLSFGNPYTENVFQDKLIKVLRKEGCLVWSIVGNVFQKVGIPDIYVAHKLWIGWLELKTENEELKLHQAKAIEELAARGVNVLVARYRRRHGVVLERVFRERSDVRCTPVIICKNWKEKFLSDLMAFNQQLV